MTCTHTSTLGVYLLGALEPEDRSTFEAHLSGCDMCRSELVRLAPLPGLLNQITLADFEDVPEVPPFEPVTPGAEPVPPAIELPGPVAALPRPVALDLPAAPPEPEVPGEPRNRRRYWLIAAAAALVLVLAVSGIVTYQALRSPAGTDHETVTWSATNSVTGAHADVELSHRPWGTHVNIWMANMPSGRHCKLVVQARSGYRNVDSYREVAGWWGTDAYDPREAIPGATSIDLADISQLEFVDDSGNVMVDMHRPG
jgi:hypothetical protein